MIVHFKDNPLSLSWNRELTFFRASKDETAKNTQFYPPKTRTYLPRFSRIPVAPKHNFGNLIFIISCVSKQIFPLCDSFKELQLSSFLKQDLKLLYLAMDKPSACIRIRTWVCCLTGPPWREKSFQIIPKTKYFSKNLLRTRVFVQIFLWNTL